MSDNVPFITRVDPCLTCTDDHHRTSLSLIQNYKQHIRTTCCVYCPKWVKKGYSDKSTFPFEVMIIAMMHFV